MALIDLGPVMFGVRPKECLIQWFQRKGLISATKQCHRCPSGTMMILRENSSAADGYKWRCPSCYTFASIRGGKGSSTHAAGFFHKSKVSLQVWMMMLWFWAINMPVTHAAKQCKIAESSAIAFYQWFRGVCSWRLLQTNIVLGGPNKIVHIDESLFGHEQKVSKIAFGMLCHNEDHKLTTPTVWKRPSSNLTTVGFWYGGHFSEPFLGLHGVGPQSDSSNTASNHPATCGSWN